MAFYISAPPLSDWAPISHQRSVIATPDSPQRQNSNVRLAVRDFMPGLLAMSAWGLVTGVAMVESGLSTYQAIGMSLLVYAGAAQLGSLPLLASGAPLPLIWAGAVVINLRFVIYALGQQGWMVRLSRPARLIHGYLSPDIVAANTARRVAEGRPGFDPIPYFRTTAALCWVGWQVCSITGILLAAGLPKGSGLGFLPSIALLAMVLPTVNSQPARACVAVSVAVSLLSHGLPLNLNLFLAVVSGLVAALLAGAGREERGPVPEPVDLSASAHDPSRAGEP